MGFIPAGWILQRLERISERMKVTLCMGSNCVMMGNMNLLTQLEDLQESMDDLRLDIETVKCLGLCKEEEHVSPVVVIDNEVFKCANAHEVMERIVTKSKKDKQ